MSFLRARQRTLTALFPHQANRKYLVPKRFPAPLATTSVSAVTTATVMTVTFDGDVSTKLGNIDGFTNTVNAIAGTITNVQQPGAKNTLVITFTPAALSTQSVVMTYTPPGELFEPLSKEPLAAWTETAVFP